MSESHYPFSIERRRLLGCVVAGPTALAAAAAWAAPVLALSELAKPGRVLMLRHANAPGIGDPTEFKLRDCSTQRLLDAAGRAQAVRLGERITQAGVARAAVYSSQWCRCLETARLLNLAAPVELPALNSFFQRSSSRDSQLAELRSFLRALPAGGPLVVMVTHQVVITSFTNEGIGSGAGAVFDIVRGSAPQLIGEIAAD